MSRFQKLRQNGSQASIVRRQRGTVDQSPVRLATGAWVLSIAPAMLPWDATSPSSCCPSVTRQTRLPPSASSTRRNTGQLQHPGIPAVHQVGAVSDGRIAREATAGGGSGALCGNLAIKPGSRRGLPGGGPLSVRRLREAALCSRRRIGPAGGRLRVSRAGFVSARRLSRVARGCRSALRRARPCLRGRGGR